ncbi:DEAD/DEAH box helicase [Thermosulfurimonas dismutans]|uniref:ATP-dependent RNA helicase RhlB n=1 Tax=Thermosulfurimonas dismutans TaxID=999894 RepID=A0A179D6F4_9BACT|nr:DEAD/DEAH box helicase [Thermosulfurimonas dismutans]OAQ21543.1 ATP-dependent RNA helicase RhlB [Thermosulfurimonas dismutans]
MESGAGEARTLSVPLNGRAFTQLPLHPRLKENLDRHGFKRSTILQDLALSEALKGKDLILKARRGSGKGIFLILAALDRLARTNGHNENKPQILVLTPSGARAKLLSSWARNLAEGLDLEIEAFSGEGEITEEELRKLEKGVDLLFTTLDGLNRALKWGLLKTFGLKILIVDELEKMVARSVTFIRNLLSKLPPPDRRQTLILMEELTYPALELAYEFTNEPEEIYIEEGRRDFTGITLSLIHVSETEKFSLLLGILKKKNWPRTLIFTNEKLSAQKLTDDLKALGLKAVFLKAELPPPLRLNFLKIFARGEAQIMVATDAGTRFIQDENLDFIINYDLPELPSDFCQRAGRIKKSEGEIISLCDETGAFFLEAIEETIGQKMNVIFPEPEEEWFVSPVEVREILGRTSRKPPRAAKPRRSSPRSQTKSRI